MQLLHFEKKGFDGLLISEQKEPGEYAAEHRIARRLVTLITAMHVAQHTARVKEYKHQPTGANETHEHTGAVA